MFNRRLLIANSGGDIPAVVTINFICNALIISREV